MAKKFSLIPVNSVDDIPDFQTEDEEAVFWATHRFGDALLERMGPIPADALPPGFEQQVTSKHAPPSAADGRKKA
jgi:hypothetical protein